VINTGSRLVLVDAGRAMAFGPTPGNALKNLNASGYDPSQVDIILITHLHGDHIGGFLDETGKPVFTNATIYVSKVECDFFLSAAVAEKAPVAMQRYFKMARDIAAPYMALGKWIIYEDGNLPVLGIKAIAIPGHTPGHTAYEISSESQTLLIWGDLVHTMAVQFPNPDVSIDFDKDQQQAIATRNALFKKVVGKSLVAGMHLPFPGIGKVQAFGDNRYIWVPVEFFQGP
jgi:glyoxylase-like metal-dependent hydrolase (beta-lactamase superfamily II)